MAAQVKLVRRRDFDFDVSELSLFNNEEGFTLVRDGWVQAAGRDGDVSVSEAITLRVIGTSHYDVAIKLGALDDKIREAGWLAENTERYSVWLRTTLPDEGSERQALVLGIAGGPNVSAYAPPLSPGNEIQEYLLAIERTPYWESRGSYSPTAPSLNCTGGVVNYTVSPPRAEPGTWGTVPARIAKTTINGAAGGGGPLYEFWLGFRTDRLGTATNLEPVWGLGADGTGSNDTTTDVVDATAHSGYRAECTFGTETELKRIQISLQSATTDYEDQRGSYTVLLRAKVGASTTCHVRLKDGFLYTSAIRGQQRVEITSTDWLLHPLGTVDIPPSHGLRGADSLRQYGFEIHASRTAGSNPLYLDCLILIPRAEGFLHVEGAAVTYSLGDTRPATITMTADGQIDGWSYQDNLPRATLTVEPDQYTLPVGTGDRKSVV